ncbi:MAG: hypothetical protein ACR2GH_04175 [Pseudonocardia sp.]
MSRIWGPPTAATDTGRRRRPVSGQTGGVPPAVGLAPQPDTTPEKLWLSWMSCINDDLDHAVTDQELTTGQHHDDGVYQAICGHTVTPQAMITAPGRSCIPCRTTLDALRPPTPPRLRWLTRLRTMLKRRRPASTT